MSEKTENPRTGDFLLSEANGTLSRENIIVDTGTLDAGTVLGQVTTGGKYVILAPAAADGSESAAGVLWSRADASGGDAAAVAIVRDAEVIADALIWPDGITANQKTTAIGQLNALGIVLR
jgi:hypothetical protein